MGCRANEMSRNWDIAQLKCRAIEMSRRWDVALEKSRANGISPKIPSQNERKYSKIFLKSDEFSRPFWQNSFLVKSDLLSTREKFFHQFSGNVLEKKATPGLRLYLI